MNYAIPKHIFKSILDITADDIRATGAKAVAFDLDNTTMYDSSYKPLDGAAEWIDGIKKSGLPIMILSNTYPRRAKKISKKFGVDYIAMSKKPATWAFFEAAKRMKVDVGELAMIGDQLFADIEGANKAGAISIWVRPFMIEKLFARKYRKIRIREKELLKNSGIE